MATLPESPGWSPDPSDIAEPSAGEKAAGFDGTPANQRLPRRWLNWFWSLASDWFDYITALVTAGSPGDVLVINAAGDGFEARAALWRRGIISGLVPANGDGAGGGDATNDLTFSAGVARDDGNAFDIVAAAAMTKRMDAPWASGAGNGGRASGAAAWGAGDWHAFLLGKSADPDAYDWIVDDDAAGSHIAADVAAGGWDLKRRGFSARTAGAAWPAFTAREIAGGGLEVLLSAPAAEFTKSWAAGADNTAQTGTLALAPGGVQVSAILFVAFIDLSAATSTGMLVSALDQADTAPNASFGSIVGQFVISNSGGIDVRQIVQIAVRLSTSRTFRYRAAATTTDHRASFGILGWIDERR